MQTATTWPYVMKQYTHRNWIRIAPAWRLYSLLSRGSRVGTPSNSHLHIQVYLPISLSLCFPIFPSFPLYPPLYRSNRWRRPARPARTLPTEHRITRSTCVIPVHSLARARPVVRCRSSRAVNYIVNRVILSRAAFQLKKKVRRVSCMKTEKANSTHFFCVLNSSRFIVAKANGAS